MSALLAIVIPYYRRRYLDASLASVAAQTDKNFKVFVGDDGSPEDPSAIIQKYRGQLEISYRRFPDNLGRTSLVGHWNRCIRETDSEWIWLFSDDDLMDPGCVAAFFAELKNSPGCHDLYRFNTRNIDAEGRLLLENEPHPALEMGSDFLCARLRDKRTSTLQELIFSRAAYEGTDGIPDFPLAWASDDAFTARMGARKPIKTIAGGRVSWRQSGASISTHLSPANGKLKIAASQMLVEWAAGFLAKFPPSGGPLSPADIRHLTSIWFFRRVYYNHTFLNLKTSLEIDRFALETWDWARGSGLAKCILLNYSLMKRRLLGVGLD